MANQYYSPWQLKLRLPADREKVPLAVLHQCLDAKRRKGATHLIELPRHFHPVNGDTVDHLGCLWVVKKRSATTRPSGSKVRGVVPELSVTFLGVIGDDDDD